MREKQILVNQAIRLVILGHEVEHKRSIVRRISEMGIELTMELFRAIEEFNIAKTNFEELESEHMALRNKIAAK